MTYDFTTIMDRRGMDAMAVDGLGSGVTGLTAEHIGYENGVWRMDFEDMDRKIKAHTIRMNLALPKSRVEEAFERLKKYVL